MSSIDWYYARGNKQMGPVSSAELKRLATAGEILPDDLVWREGLAEWTSARNVRGLFEDEGKPANAEEAFSQPIALSRGVEPAAQPQKFAATSDAAALRRRARHLVDVLLDSLRIDFDARFVEATARLFRACGLYGLLAAMVAAAAFAAIAAIKTNALGNLLQGVLLLVLLAALQYAAGKFCDVLDRLNRAAGSSLTSTVFPDCFALLSLVAGLTALFGSVPAAVHASMYPLVLLGIAGFIVCSYSAFVAMNPSTLNVSILADETSAGEEAIGVLTFLLKALLRAAPVALGAGVLAGTLMMGIACYEAFFSVDGPMAAQITAAAARIVLVSSAALPLAAYLLFLLCSLSLDLCRAILVLPGKPERPTKPIQSREG